MANEIDEKTLAKLRGLDENAMREIITRLAAASGMNEEQARAMAKNTGFIKRRLAVMNPSEVKKLVSSADENTVSDILKSLKSGEENGGNGK